MARLTQDDLRRMTPEKRKAYEMQKRRVERNRKILGTFVCIILVLLTTVVLSLTVFFKVDTIVVNGDSIYDENQIINASGISAGDNLFLCNLKKASDGICKNLPYISTVEVKRELPSSIIFEITPTKAYVAAKSNSGTMLIDKEGKILEIVSDDKVPKNVIKLDAGITFSNQLGENIFDSESESEQGKKTELLKTIFDAIDNSKLSNITAIDIKSSSNISIMYQNRLNLKVGSISEVEYKLKCAVGIIKELDENEPNKKGEILLSNTKSFTVIPEEKN